MRQPLPERNAEAFIPDLLADRYSHDFPEIMRMIQERAAIGEQKYGTRLQPWNGRDAVRDLLEEILDGIQYSYQAFVETRDLMYENITVELFDLADRIRDARSSRGAS